jgi:hypothetical protein
MPTTAGGTAASEWGIGDLLTRGRIAGTPSIASGGTTFVDIDCAGDAELTVMCDLAGAANGDLAVTVVPYEGTDNVTLLSNAPLPVIRSTGPLFASGSVSFTGTYDVSGVARVRVIVKNNNAGAQNLNRLSWRLS